MTWRIELDEDARKTLKKLDKSIARQITQKLREISALNDPTDMGKPLRANRKGFWAYRVGNYRVICEIQRQQIVVLVLEISHRSEAYR